MARLALVAVLVLAACTSEAPDPPAPEAPAPRGADAEPLAEPAGPPAVRLDEVLAPRSDDGPFLRGLPEPQSTRAEPTENRHVEGQTDTVRTAVYPGLEIESYEVTGGRTFVQRVEVTDPRYETERGLAVGRTRGAIESTLGVPVEEDGPVAIYETVGDPTATTVEVRYETDAAGDERATRITWRPYVD